MHGTTPTAQNAGTMTPFNWEDPFDLDSQLTEEERMIREAAHGFAQSELQPRVIAAFREEIDAPELFPLMGKAGLLGATIPPEFGGAGAGYVAYGLIAREIEWVDSGYRSMASVQSSLVMHPIYAYGSDEQRRQYLPGLAAGELIGCFGLTEADGGSDPASMKTKAVKVEGGYRLNGGKYWITNSPIADLAIVWAKLEDVIRGFIVERGFDGFARKIWNATMCEQSSGLPTACIRREFLPTSSGGPARMPAAVPSARPDPRGAEGASRRFARPRRSARRFASAR